MQAYQREINKRRCVTAAALLAVSLNSEHKGGQRQSYDNRFGEAVQLRDGTGKEADGL